MSALRAAIARLTGLVTRARRERAFDEELESHLQLHVDDNIRAGMSLDEARRHAVIALGGIESTRQLYRERSSLPWVEHVAQDVRFTLRQFRSRPGFAITAVLVLALGFGAGVAILAFVDAALIAPLPYRSPERLVEVTETSPDFPRGNLSYLNYLDWKQQASTLEGLDIYAGRNVVLGAETGPAMVRAARVTDGFFRTLGVAPALGRDFHAGEDRPGGEPTAILSHAAWQSRFAARPDVVGVTVTLNGVPRTIVGVLPADFHFAPVERAEFWLPLQPAGSCDLRRSCHAFHGVGRLRDGVSVETALAEFTAIAARLEAQYPDANRGQGARVVPLAGVIVGTVRPILFMLLGGAGLLLLLACVNVASLLLVRTEGRRRELAVRGALGASAPRLAAQFTTEAVVIAGAGAAAGFWLAGGLVPILHALIPADMAAAMPFLDGAQPNARVAGCAAAVAGLAAVAFALVPIARLSGIRIGEGLVEGSRGSSGEAWRRLGSRLVVAELATAVVLLAGAGLLGRSLHQLLDVELGFQPDGLVAARVVASGPGGVSDADVITFTRRTLAALEGIPGVETAAVTSVLPVSFNGNTDWIRFVGRPWDGRHTEVNMREVSAGYFGTLGAPLLRGRAFAETDDEAHPRVAIVNRTLAERYFPGEDAIGKQFGDTGLTPDSIRTIVGVVDDIREGALDSEIWPAVYYPVAQSPSRSFAVVARTSPGIRPGSVLPSLRAALREVDPDAGLFADAVMRERIANSPVAYLQRSSAGLVGGFAAFALLLGIVGTYGVIAYSVSQRTREIGVRLAMGAQPAAVSRMVLGEAGRLALAGIALGSVGAIGAATLMRNLLFGTPPWDLVTLGGVAAVLAAATAAASWIPARRAAAIDPVDALRAE